MKLNKTIIKFISILTSGIDKTDRFLSLNQKSATLQIENSPLVKINEESILFLGKEDISKKIFPALQEKTSSHTNFEQLNKFCSNINVLRLNHLGVSYSCADINKEIGYLKKLSSKANFKLFEEKSGMNNQRWFFLGNLNSWEYPLFEIVLTESKESLINEWIPHFQIDIDTAQSFEELESLTTKYLNADFFGWKLDVPNYGIVLAMGKLGNINGTKIYLGMGTKLRDTKFHRNKLLIEV
ncbi:MAG: hypothetical protein R6U54_01670 [Candidatus Omnitrophota bacterium]